MRIISPFGCALHCNITGSFFVKLARIYALVRFGAVTLVFNEANAYFEELKEDEQEKREKGEEGDVRLRGRSCGCRVSPPILPHKPLQVLNIELLV